MATAEASDAQGPKFGTFLGVYTPSVLTILGVIMYQRLGWVIGNTGFGGTLAIIALAHVISISTGLSVASIATNRAVKTGGNYYILSRSLGLSIGGAIGIALYLALALGVSLYLIGFAEAILAVPQVSQYLASGSPAQDIRVVGSLALVALAIITWVSTSFALKTQIFVMVAIVLSLASVFLGSPPEVANPTSVPVWAPPDSTAFATVFAVFFPAVTGFTAGVGMSGDLKDPKRAIPIGTMVAIATGLVIYLMLTWFLASTLDLESLRTDNNILLRVAWVPGLVTAGVSAATLSSALGSLLGAPRTLQALAFDAIMPRFFGQNGGEPRRALLVTLVIAEAGILVGDLDVVGAVISMFFLTCYGFLCLACGLEAWASSDFRPTFPVPIWVSLVGAIACFMVMFQINAAAMFGSILIMGLLYVVLKRRQLVLGSGDTWGGVWSAVVRLGLLRLRASASHRLARNWRPNMVVMSRSKGREALLGLGRALVGDRGLITHFELRPGASLRPQVDAELEAKYPGMFARVQGCDDVFQSIPELVQNFGLAGMETNVVLLGWPLEAGRHAAYAKMIDRLTDLDLSLLVLRLDAERVFGKHERVDIWWDGESPAGQLMLTLAFLLTNHPDWKNAHLRVLVTGRDGQDDLVVQRRLEAAVSEARVKAEAKLLAPLTSSDHLAARIRAESRGADLVIVHAKPTGEDGGFVRAHEALLEGLGTTLLVRAAPVFSRDAAVFLPERKLSTRTAELNVTTLTKGLLDPELHPYIEKLDSKIQEALHRFEEFALVPSFEEERRASAAFVEEVTGMEQLGRTLLRRGERRQRARALLDWAKNRFGGAVVDKLAPLQNTRARESSLSADGPWESRLLTGLRELRTSIRVMLDELPMVVSLPSKFEHFEAKPGDSLGRRLYCLSIRSLHALGVKLPDRKMPLSKLAEHAFNGALFELLDAAVDDLGLRRIDLIGRLRQQALAVEKSLDSLQLELDRSTEEDFEVGRFVQRVNQELEEPISTGRSLWDRFEDTHKETRTAFQALMTKAQTEFMRSLRKNSSVPRRLSIAEERKRNLDLEAKVRAWGMQQSGLLQAQALDMQVVTVNIDLRRALSQMVATVRRLATEGPLSALSKAEEVMSHVVELRTQEEEAQADVQASYLESADALRATWEGPKRIEVDPLIEALMAAVGRAAERLPQAVLTRDDAAWARLDVSEIEDSLVSYPVRRNMQSFLEHKVVDSVRELLLNLPQITAELSETLVDVVRLVAFELEQAGRSQAESMLDGTELTGSLALGGMLEARLERVRSEQQTLRQYLDTLEKHSGDRALEASREGRQVIVGQAHGKPRGTKVRGRLANEIMQRAATVSGASKAALRVVTKPLPGRRVHAVEPQGMVERIQALRSQLLPDHEVQSSLPLVYRRIFGRSALDTPDLLVGRELEMSRLQDLVGRWKEGTGGPIAIIGRPRSGRTTLAQVIGKQSAEGREVIRLRPKSEAALSIEHLNAVVVEAVGGRPGQTAEAALRATPPGGVFVIDELGDWIDRAPGGFDLVHQWLRIWRKLGDRHLFLVVTSSWAFAYAEALSSLRGALLGSIRLSPLTAEELEALIRLRQHTVDLALDFESQNGSSFAPASVIARRQFKRLYEQSNGNIGDALDLWWRSVRSVTERRVMVSVPPLPNQEVLEALPMPWVTMLSALAFHRRANAARLGRLLRMSREAASQQAMDLERAGLVSRSSDGAYALDPVLQPWVLRMLENQGVLR